MTNVRDVVSVLLLAAGATALPILFKEETLCRGGRCEHDDYKYERIIPSQPG